MLRNLIVVKLSQNYSSSLDGIYLSVAIMKGKNMLKETSSGLWKVTLRLAEHCEDKHDTFIYFITDGLPFTLSHKANSHFIMWFSLFFLPLANLKSKYH